MSDIIRIESRVNSKDLAGMVVLRWGNESGELTPAQARQHALAVLATAEAAEHDAAMVHWLMQGKIGLDLRGALTALGDMRVFRGMG